MAIELHKSQVLLYSLLGFLVGTGTYSLISPQVVRVFVFLLPIAGIVFVTSFWGNKLMLASGLCLVLAGVGMLRAQTAEVVPINSIIELNDSGEIIWQGVVAEEPDVREDRVNLTMVAERLLAPEERAISGRVLLTTARYPEYAYGDELKITGKLETPFETEEFSYKNYLAKSRIFSTQRYAQVEKLASSRGHPVTAGLLALKAQFLNRLALILPEPQNALLAGLLLGAKRAIGGEWLEKFKLAGVSHIIAISGFNISIITRILGDFFRRLFGQKSAFLLCLLIVAGFVVITGAAASVVRAAIMGLLVVVALNLGRATQALNLLLLTAGVMVAVNPAILVFDVGFQLSFLATFGLMFLAPTLEKLLARVPKVFELRTILAATLAAQIFVLPLLIHYFDQLSLIAPLSNLFILPTIPWAMFFGFFSGALAMLWLPLAYLFTWITWLLLTYILQAIAWSASVPYAALAAESISPAWIAVYYLLLGVFIFWLWARERERRLNEFLHPTDQIYKSDKSANSYG